MVICIQIVFLTFSPLSETFFLTTFYGLYLIMHFFTQLQSWQWCYTTPDCIWHYLAWTMTQSVITYPMGFIIFMSTYYKITKNMLFSPRNSPILPIVEYNQVHQLRTQINKICIGWILCCIFSNLTVVQLNLQYTILVNPSRLTLCLLIFMLYDHI